MQTPTLEQLLHLIEEREKVAYQRGWNEATASIMAAAQHGRPTATLPIRTISQRPRIRLPEHLKEQARPKAKVIDVIFEIIREQPGLRGIEIFREAVSRMPGSDIKTMDRTGRTALQRLAKRGKITQRAKRWFVKE